MKKRQVDHVLRAAGRITGEKQFIIIGSQSLHGKYPDVADDILRSFEVDLIAKRDPSRSEWLNVIGQDSQFHEQFGYYADPVDENTALLPKGWKARLVNLPEGETDGVRGLCLDPHDLRDRHRCSRSRQGSGIYPGTRNPRPCCTRSPGTIARRNSCVRRNSRTNSKSDCSRLWRITCPGIDFSLTIGKLEQLRARAQQDWLKLRQMPTRESSGSEIGRSKDRFENENPRDRGLEFDDDSRSNLGSVKITSGPCTHRAPST